MDYCQPCRRHLNGALACAGCGTPVEELRHHTPHAPAAEPFLPQEEVPEPSGHRRTHRQSAPRPKPSGSRRAHKRRGRKVVFGVLGGLVIAAGALSLAELAIEDPGDDGAATSVKEQSGTETEPAPEPTDDDEKPDGPAPVTESAVSAPVSVRPTGTASGTGTADASPSTTDPADRPSSLPSSSDRPSGSAKPSLSPGQSTPAGPSESSPSAEPSPSETCDRFLWFCV